jgi:hypothetical protein
MRSVFVGVAVGGLWLVAVERDRESPSAVRRGFLGASFLWTWVQVLFYGGWLIGPASLAAPIPVEAPWWALLTFRLGHQAASINIFLGVENPGRGFFPEGTTFLESYFGPQRNSWVLPVTVALVLDFTLRVGIHAIRDASPMRRQAMMLLTVLGALGVLELAVLGAPVNLALWDWFLALHGY